MHKVPILFGIICSVSSVFSQVKYLELNDSLINIDGKVIYDSKRHYISTRKEVESNFDGYLLKAVNIKSRLYPSKFSWLFLQEDGIAFELPWKKERFERIRLFFVDNEIKSNRIKGVKTFSGKLSLNGVIITNESTLGQLKISGKFRTYEKDKLGYLTCLDGQVEYFLYFDNYTDSGKIQLIVIEMPPVFRW